VIPAQKNPPFGNYPEALRYNPADVSSEALTQRVSVHHPSDRLIGAAITPPPSGELKMSAGALAAVSAATASAPGTPARVGDKLFGFELVEELGQGAFARVFLAKQESLAQRSVAIKVTLRPTLEPERLARLQHTHIVPVYSVHTAGSVQVICMPYLGRRTISDLIRAFRKDNPLSGASWRKTSGTRAAKSTTTGDSRSSPKTTAPSGSYARPAEVSPSDGCPDLIGKPREVLHLLGQLAAGLAHAHERGILHLDLKPANVLLADTGEPMLLDFNLSFDVKSPDRELIGGTIPYMSVEQLQDLRTRGKGHVDARTDLYSLGVMAFEMLTGTVPFPASFLADTDGLIAVRRKGPPSIRALNPWVSPGEEAIVHKLLAPRPEDRYQTAEELRTDIERHLTDRPLAFTREPSVAERVTKWRRRNPRVPAQILAAALMAVAVAAIGVARSQAETTARAHAAARLTETRSVLDRIRLDLVLPGDLITRARGIKDAADLLASYGLPDAPNWHAHDSVRNLPESERTALGGDLGELLLLLAQVRWLEAEGKTDEERSRIAAEARKLTTAARGCFPPSSVPAVLESQSRTWSRVLGEEAGPPTPLDPDQKGSAREWFLDATAEIANGRYAKALANLEKTIEEQPAHAAAQFCLAYCRQKLGQRDRSLERYDVARVLLPRDPRPAFQRGLIYGMDLRPALAEKEMSKAIDLKADYAHAYFNRALARSRLAKYAEAEQDFTTALGLGSPAIQVHLLRAEVREKRGDKIGAKADRTAASTLPPKLEGDYLVRGLTRIEDDPAAAIADFKTAATINSRSMPAFMNHAYVLDAKYHDQTGALEMITRAATMYPEYAPARIGRALMLAKTGDRKGALEELQQALALSDDSDICFRAACVYSVTSKGHPDDVRKALDFLRQAVRKGYRDAAAMEKDEDLNGIRDTEEYRQILRAIVTLK
jgi:serine/threonine protein kinase/tetratricopeptide (TPR) repeat protein